jgi:hypothetical protein
MFLMCFVMNSILRSIYFLLLHIRSHTQIDIRWELKTISLSTPYGFKNIPLRENHQFVFDYIFISFMFVSIFHLIHLLPFLYLLLLILFNDVTWYALLTIFLNWIPKKKKKRRRISRIEKERVKFKIEIFSILRIFLTLYSVEFFILSIQFSMCV